MSPETEFSHRTIAGRCIDTAAWPTPDEGALSGQTLSLYLARKLAVRLYLAGESAETIKQQCSMSAKQAYRLIRERCLQPHSDGLVYGWRALVPHLRIKPYKRHRKVRVDSFGNGAAGALEAMLDRHPDLREDLDARIRAYSKGKGLEEVKRTARQHYIWFLDRARGLGYEGSGEWPFGTDSKGYYSVRRYSLKVLSSDPKALAGVAGGPELIRKLKAGDGSNRPVSRFMQRVEMDAHKLDGRFCVSIPKIDGSTEEKIVHRLWVIVILEVISRAVLGYYFSVRKEVSSDDVLRAIKRATTKWPLRQVTFSDLPYTSGAGLLSTNDPQLVGLCWDETSVDGALAETCARVRTTLKEVVGSVLLEPKTSFAARRSLDDRPFIETFFRRLASGGFQRLSNTTGSKAAERKGRDPDKVALTSRFQYEYAEELLDVLIANYNATPHKGIGNRTPLAYARFLYEQAEQKFRYADPSVLEATCSVRRLCRVRGGAAVGRGVFVEFYYGRYSNDLLQNRQDLVGKQIWVVSHKEDDARIALASTLDGTSLGILRAAPPWNLYPHSLAVRTAISQAIARGQFIIPAGADGVETFINYVELQRDKRLPVHPAYLEVRRILSSALDLSVGETLLSKARADLDVPPDKHAPQRPQRQSSPRSTSASDANATESTLPPRRAAATRP
jgi:hypothetical protein